jgi:hypothetical protein
MSLEIIPKTAQATVRMYSARFYAWAHRRDGSRTDVTDKAKWTSSSSRIAYPYSPGTMEPLSPGIATVEASFEGPSDTATLTVDGMGFDTITLDVPVKVLAIGDTEDLTLSALRKLSQPHQHRGSCAPAACRHGKAGKATGVQARGGRDPRRVPT